MRSKFIIIALGSALAAGCQTAPGHDNPAMGFASVNVPVVSSADYVFDAAAPGGALASGDGERLNGWFQGLGLGYGDTIYVDGGYAPSARAQVGQSPAATACSSRRVRPSLPEWSTRDRSA